MTEDKFFTPKEVARMLKVTYMTVYRWLKSGKLQSLKAGKQYRIKKNELDMFLKGYKKIQK